MAGKEIYPEHVFKNQTNSTVFYKEGRLNDPLMGEQISGTFESWKYDYDAGRQIFRATDTDKVFEKRLIKDKFGNPHWSHWMEICPGEANGIQAIAVNNQPLQLPNTDGAIKLQITPQMIDTYTKREIYDLITSKINEEYSESYEYVSWIEGCETHLEVLEQTYPDGGVINKFYLVEPKPVTGSNDETAHYFVWELTEATTKNGGYKWIEVNTPNLKSFVSYSAFNRHVGDDIIHVTAEDRERWDQAAVDAAAGNEKVISIADAAKEIAADALKQIEEHIADVGELTSPHISVEERKRLNNLFENVQDMPDNPNRYVVENGTYSIAYEQTSKSEVIETKLIKDVASSHFKDGTPILTKEDDIISQFNALTSTDNIVDSFIIETYGVAVFGDNNKWYIETDTGFVSDFYDKNKTSVTIDVPFSVIPSVVTVKCTNKDDVSGVSINSIKAYIHYIKKTGVDIGDSTKRLPVNLVGPEDVMPTYNGEPLSSIMPDYSKVAEWGHISGTIENQVDLGLKIAEAISGKINHADMSSHLRWDVYRDGVIKSICQQTDKAEETTLIIPATNSAIKNGGELITDIQSKLTKLKEDGFVVYSAKLVIENVSAFQDAKTNLPIPVYFTTDNSGIAPSPSFVGKFSYDWPGSFFGNYNTIYVHGGDVEYCTNARLEVKAVKYGDIVIGLHNEIEDKEYSITIKADVLNELAEEIILKSNGDIVANAAKDLKLAAEKVISIGGKSYEYGAEKVDAETAEADNAIYIYGQEADERYAGRALFETEIAERKEADEAEALERKTADDTEKEERIAADEAEAEERKAADEDETTERKAADEAEKEERIAAIEQEIADRQAADEDFAKIAKDNLTALEGEITSKIADLEEDINAKITEALNKAQELVDSVKEEAAQVQENLDEEIALREKADEALTSVIDENKVIFDEYADKTDKEIEDLKNSINDYNLNNVETFDLVINDPEELASTIADGTFESSERILFKKGTYENIDVDKSVSFASIKYIKAEKGVFINLPNAVCPKAYDNTEFDGMNIIMGYGQEALIIEDGGERTKTVTASGETTIKLLPQYSIYKVEVLDDADITFENVIDGKEYTVFIDQGDDVKEVKVSNFSENNSAEFSSGLENQVANLRTAIKFAGDNSITSNGMIVEEVIYGLTGNPSATENIEVVAKNTLVEIYGSTEKAKAVSFDEDEVVAITNPGKTFTIAPAILDNWAHNEDGPDYKVVCEDGTVIGEGNCDTSSTFKVPFSVKVNEDGSMPKINIVFDVKPQLVTIKMDGIFTKYVESSSKVGFTKVQAGQEANIGFDMAPGYTLYGITHAQISNIWQGSFPYTFVPKNNTEHIGYDLYITPKFYRDIKDFTLKTVSEYPFNHEKVALVGPNEMTIEAEFVAPEDANFGTLYTAAPVTLVGSDDYSGEVEFEDAGKTQSANIYFNESTLDNYVDVTFAIAGHSDNIVKTFYIGRIGGGTDVEPVADLEVKDSKHVLDTFVGEAREFKFSVLIENSNDSSGTWKVSDTKVAKIVGAVDNNVTVAALTKGPVRLMFTSNFTGLTHEASLLVVTHAKTVDVADMRVSTDTVELKPRAIWYDFNDNVIEDTSVITDTTGLYDAPADNVYVTPNDEKDALTVRNVPLPEGTAAVTEEYEFKPTDTLVENIKTGVATIISKLYGITFTVAEGSDIESVTIYGAENEVVNSSCSVVGGGSVTIVIKLKDGVIGKYESILSEAFGDYEFAENEIESKKGYFRAMLKMPYKNVSFDLN